MKLPLNTWFSTVTLAETVKTYAAEKPIEPIKQKEIEIPTVLPETTVVEEAAKAVVPAVVPSHSWLYYTGIGLAILVVTGATYYFSMNYFYGTPSSVRILTPPGKNGVSFGYVQHQKPYPLYEYINDAAHYVDLGAGKIIGAITFLGVPALGYFRSDKHSRGWYWLKRDINPISPTATSVIQPDPVPFVNGNYDSGIEPSALVNTKRKGVVRIPESLKDSTPEAKPKYLLETKQKAAPELQFEEPKLEQIPQPEPLPPQSEPLPPQFEAIDRFINELTMEEMQMIVSSPKFLAWQSQPEQYAFAFEQIMQSPDRMVAIMQIFGGA